jgi:hypothetical protein
MKYLKMLLLLTCILQVKLLNAQGNNLQFNQAIYVTISLNGVLTTTQSFTVPANKVWKIESAGTGFPDGAYQGFLFPGGSLGINNSVIYSCPYGVSLASVLPNVANFPIWLPSGTYSLKLSVDGGTSPWNGFISGVEYNLIP